MNPTDMVKHRFPNIYEYCLQYGLDLTTDWIPVAPAAHYMMGGVKTDLNGETNIRSRCLPAAKCPPPAFTVPTGWRATRCRRRSYSDVELLSGSIRCRLLERDYRLHMDSLDAAWPRLQAVVEKRLKLQKIMVRYAGLRRDGQGLSKGLEELNRPAADFPLGHSRSARNSSLRTC